MCRTLFLLGLLIVVQGHAPEDDMIKDGCYYSGDSSVCWDVDDYPLQDIQRKLATTDNDYTDMFGRFRNDPTLNMTSSRTPCTLCKTKLSFYMRPQLLMEKGKKCYVVNTNNYHATIRYNICDTNQKNSKCWENIADLPQDLQTECVQKTTVIRLLCYNPESANFEAWVLHYPSSCVCAVGKMF